MTRLTMALGALLVVAQSAAAQSAPNIMKPRQAAQRAVAATNAQVAANSTIAEDSAVSKASPAVESRGVDSAAAPSAKAAAAGASTGAVAATSAAKGTGSAFQRETFAYDRVGRRDPFVSLMNTSELRPLVTDLKLVAVAFDPTGRNSVAILHDLGTKDQYRIRVGQSLGRMRVSAITTRTVVFTIEEFGYSRQETLALGDSNKARKE